MLPRPASGQPSVVGQVPTTRWRLACPSGSNSTARPIQAPLTDGRGAEPLANFPLCESAYDAKATQSRAAERPPRASMEPLSWRRNR